MSNMLTAHLGFSHIQTCNLFWVKLFFYLLVKLEQLQQLDAQQQADLVELLSDVEVAFEVMAGQ